MVRGVVWALALAAGAAQAQGAGGDRQQGETGMTAQGGEQPPGGSPQGDAGSPQVGAAQQQATSDAFDRACIDLLEGRMPADEAGIKALKDACNNVVSSRADERIRAAEQQRAQRLEQEERRRQQARVAAGQSTAAPGQGEGVRAAFAQAGSELTGNRRRPLGYRGGGPVLNSIFTNPVGWFTGLGVNAELYHSFDPRLSWVVGARYSTTDATNGTTSTFGAMGGVDLFVIGRNNEGLRIGPRIELAAGRENFGGSATFARLGMSGEVGWDFIASNGISGFLAAGVGGRVAGDSKNQGFASFVGGEFGPYLKLGLGYSW